MKPVVVAFLPLAFLGGAFAQTSPSLEPGGLQSRDLEAVERLQRQQELEQAPDRDPSGGIGGRDAGRPEQPATEAGPRFVVSRIEVEQSAILDDAAIRSAVVPYEGRVVSLGELQQAVEAINRLYAEAGVVTARALLPEQAIEDGVVRIRLVEARLGHMAIEGNDRLGTGFVTERVRLIPGEVLRTNDLEADLVRFNHTNESQLRARLARGERFGTTDLILQLVEPKPRSLIIGYDNAGREATGVDRYSVTWRETALFGRSDPLRLNLGRSDGADSGYLVYEAPIGTRGIRAGVTHARDSTAIGSGPFAALGITGRATTTLVTLSGPLALGMGHRITGRLHLARKRSETAFSGLPVSESTVRTAGFGIDGQWFGNSRALLTGHELVVGDGETLSGPIERFEKYQGYLLGLQRLGSGVTLRGKAFWQLAGRDQLPSTELFQVGGALSVRGYEEGLLSGDDGYYLNFEATHPLVEAPITVHGLAFVDHGAAFPYRVGGGSRSDDYITSAGIGLQLTAKERLTANITYGVPLHSRDDGKDSPAWHFQLSLDLL